MKRRDWGNDDSDEDDIEQLELSEPVHRANDKSRGMEVEMFDDEDESAEEEEEITIEDLEEVFAKSRLYVDGSSEIDDNDVADLSSLARYIKWSMAAPQLSNKLISLNEKGIQLSLFGLYHPSNILLLRETAWSNHVAGPCCNGRTLLQQFDARAITSTKGPSTETASLRQYKYCY